MAIARQQRQINESRSRLPAQAVHNPIGGVVPLAHTRERKGLCAVAYPRLHSAQHTQDFHFFDATLLLVLSGELRIAVGETHCSVNNAAGLCFVDQGVAADLSKYPAPGGQFRSIYLTLSPAVIARFSQQYPELSVSSRLSPPLAILPADDDQLVPFHQLLIDLESHQLSDLRLELRVFDLLLSLAEQGKRFSVQQNSISDRLKAILLDAPHAHWTAQRAGHALAMSEATLRRRLAEAGVRFDKLLLDIRMHHALMLLQTTSWNLLQIADACGYRSQARFSERFKARFGVSPAHIR